MKFYKNTCSSLFSLRARYAESSEITAAGLLFTETFVQSLSSNTATILWKQKKIEIFETLVINKEFTKGISFLIKRISHHAESKTRMMKYI